MSPKSASKPHVVHPTLPDSVELSRHLLKAEEEERRRISRELHDETGQALMVLRFQLEMLACDAASEEQKAKMQESVEVLDRAIEGVRRIIARLSPRVLEELGLIAAIRRQAQLLARRTSMKAHLQLQEDLPAMDHDIEVALYRSVQEALHNIAKHSQARNFTVRLRAAEDKVWLQIQDDGVGVLTKDRHEKGFGLTGMRERTVALGGSIKLQSEIGKGTQIRILLPRIALSANQTVGGDPVRRVPTTRAS